MEVILQLGLPFQGDCGGRDGVVDEHCHGGGGTHHSVMSCRGSGGKFSCHRVL